MPTLRAALYGVFDPLAAYLALVTRNNPYGSANALLARPDVSAMLDAALAEAVGVAGAAVDAAWDESGAAETAMLGHLAEDIARLYYSPAPLQQLIREAYESIPQGQFVVGVTPPGQHPVMEAAIQRAAAISRAVLAYATQSAQRNELTVVVARTAGQTAAALEHGAELAATGQSVLKRWVAKQDDRTCIWCQFLHGTVVPLHTPFPLPGPVALEHQVTRRVRTPAGVDRYHQGIGTRIVWTHPPRPYRGILQGPPLHPRCRCRLEIVVRGTVQEVGGQVPERSPAPRVRYLAAVDVRAMPEDRYRALLAFLRAASHELGQALHRLAGVSGG